MSDGLTDAHTCVPYELTGGLVLDILLQYMVFVYFFKLFLMANISHRNQRIGRQYLSQKSAYWVPGCALVEKNRVEGIAPTNDLVLMLHPLAYARVCKYTGVSIFSR